MPSVLSLAPRSAIRLKTQYSTSYSENKKENSMLKVNEIQGAIEALPEEDYVQLR